MNLALAFLVGGAVGFFMAALCAVGHQDLDRIDTFMLGWKSGFRAALHMDDVPPDPLFRSIETIEAEKLIRETGGTT